MCKTNSNPTFSTLFPKNKKTPTNIDVSTFVGVLSFLNLTHFYLKIPVVGVEPTLQKEHDFESCASANSATPAYSYRLRIANIISRQRISYHDNNTLSNQFTVSFTDGINRFLPILLEASPYEWNHSIPRCNIVPS